MEQTPDWQTELHVRIVSRDERTTLEEFTLKGRAVEVHVPKTGELLEIMDSNYPGPLRVVQSQREALTVVRRSAPWTVKARYRIVARVDEAPSPSGYSPFA